MNFHMNFPAIFTRDSGIGPISRQEHDTANHFEKEYGIEQAVRIGQNIFTAGISSTSLQGFPLRVYGRSSN